MNDVRFSSILTAIVFLFSLSSVVFADTIESSNVTINLLSEEKAEIVLDSQFSKVTTNRISFIFNADIISVKGYDSLGPINCKLSQRSFGTEVGCEPTITNIIEQNISTYKVHLEMTAENLVTTERSEEAVFSFTYPVTSPTKQLHVTVMIPEGKILLDTGEVKPYFPANAQITTTGRQVVLDWHVEKPVLGDAYIFRALFESSVNRVQRWIFVSAIVLSILVVVSLTVFTTLRIRKRMQQTPLIKTVFSVLRADERKVLDVLVAQQGSCKQRDIVKKTDFSKAKVSRIITDLEKRGIVEKDRTGRTNKIVLKDPTQNVEKKEQKAEEVPKEDDRPRFGA